MRNRSLGTAWFLLPFGLFHFCSPLKPCPHPHSLQYLLSVLEAVMRYLLIKDGLRQVFRVLFLLDVKVGRWCGDIEHDKPCLVLRWTNNNEIGDRSCGKY